MKTLILSNLDHFLAILILISRLGDIISTYMATPDLKLEMNPVMKKLKWPFAILTVFVCFVPYFDIPSGIVILVPSLLVCYSNFSGLWLVRALGEDNFKKLILAVCRGSNFTKATNYAATAMLFLLLLGFTMVHIFSTDKYAGLIGFGIMMYAWGICIYKWLSLKQLFREAQDDQYELIIRNIRSEVKPII